MITILSVDENNAKVLAAKEQIKTPVLAMEMSDGSEKLGYVLYRVEKNVLEILKLFSCDSFLEEGLVRAALNDGVNRRATMAICCDTTHFLLLESLGFSLEENRMTIFIPDFFNRPCQH